MSTVNNNNFLAGQVSQEGMLMHGHVPIDNTNFPFHQGDLLWWDSSAHIAKPVTSDADAATLLGAALGASAVNSNIDNSVANLALPDVNIGFAGIFQMKTTASDSYNNGSAVYAGADAQTVTSTAGMATSPVGVVRLAPRGSAITGATGVTVPVLIYSRAWIKYLA
jgi:hypothetical protein